MRTIDTSGLDGDDGADDKLPCVPFVPFRCPRCGRHKPYTYAVRGRLRYHRCQHCGQRYRSWELDAKAVKDWEPPQGGS